MTTATERRVFIRGEAWIAGEHNVDPDDGFWAKGVGANIEVEKPEPGEVSIQILVGRDEDRTADASFYMSNQEAFRLMAALGQAVLVDADA